jgi:hypothetical protein
MNETNEEVVIEDIAHHVTKIIARSSNLISVRISGM